MPVEWEPASPGEPHGIVAGGYKMPVSNENPKAQPGKPLSYRHPAGTGHISNENCLPGPGKLQGDLIRAVLAAYIYMYVVALLQTSIAAVVIHHAFI